MDIPKRITPPSPWIRAGVGLAQCGLAAVLLALLDRFVFRVPSPIPFLLLMVAYTTYRGGPAQGLPGVFIMFGHALVILSTPGRLFHYEGIAGLRLAIMAILPLLIVWMMGLLRSRIDRMGADLQAHSSLAGELGQQAASEESLRHWQAQHQILFDSVPAMIWYKDLTGRIVRVNKPAAESIGRTVAEVEGRLTQDLYPEQSGKYVGDDRTVIMSGRPKLGIIEKYEIPTGEERWVRTDKIPYRDESGQLLGVIVFAVDITPQKLAEDELARSRDELEARVRDRTAELERLNENLRREIAERLRGEEALRASEARFRTMGETIATAAFIFQGTKLLDVNPAAERITGYTREELIGQEFWRVIHPEDREQVAQRGMARQRGEPVPASYEVRILRKDGQTRWVDFTAGMIEMNGQDAILGTAHDITDRMQTEAALRESEERFRLVFEQAAAGIAHLSVDGRYLNVNQRLCDLLGYSRNELLNRRFHDVTHPEDLPRDARALQQMIDGEMSSYETQKRYRRRDGSTAWTYLRVNLIRDPANAPKYFVSVIEDIDERKRAQEALRQSEEQLQAILDYTTAVIYVKDIEGRYTLVNRRFEELFHVDRSRVIGRTDQDVFPSETAEQFRVNDCAVLNAGIAMKFEENAPQDDGMHFYVSLKFPIGDASGRPRAVCGISTDISERKRMEVELRNARDAAEEASRAKSRFLANVSHEIRTPIMAMLGAAEFIRSGHADAARLPGHGDLILRNGRHLLALVDDLLDQSRLDAGRLTIVSNECSLLDIMADVHALTSPLQRQRAVEFGIVYETQIPERIVTDRTRLTQAIVNLVHNALKFTTCGHVFVRVRADRASPADTLSIVVEDTGSGIAEADLHRIFEPFTQVEPISVGASAGLGLGLPLAKWFIERLGGGLEVQSELGKGSRFSIMLPAHAAPDTPWIEVGQGEQEGDHQQGITAPESPSLDGWVLLAEDADDVRALMTEALSCAGAQVVAVADGRAAVETARTRVFDLILLDIRMPEMDGFEAARALRAANCRSTIIALTASTAQREVERMYEAGFDELWAKPISLEQLVLQAAAYMPAAGATPAEPRKLPPGKAGSAAQREDRVAQLVAEYQRSLRARISKLREAVDREDRHALHGILHQLVGSAGAHGFMDLSHRAADVMASIGHGGELVDEGKLDRLLELMHSIATLGPADQEPGGGAGDR